jgi:hypothetical protein
MKQLLNFSQMTRRRKHASSRLIQYCFDPMTDYNGKVKHILGQFGS